MFSLEIRHFLPCDASIELEFFYEIFAENSPVHFRSNLGRHRNIVIQRYYGAQTFLRKIAEDPEKVGPGDI